MLITTLCLSMRDVREEFLISVFLRTLSCIKKTRNKNRMSSSAVPLNGREKVLRAFFNWRWSFSVKRESHESLAGTTSKWLKRMSFQLQGCRARRVVENVFGFASSVFRMLRKPMLLEPEKAQLVVTTIACLHNCLRRSLDSAEIYAP